MQTDSSMASATTDAEIPLVEKGSSLGRDAWVRLKKNKMAMQILGVK